MSGEEFSQISDAYYRQDSENSVVPADFNLLMFLYKGRILWTDYQKQPKYVYGRMQEMIVAKNDGLQRQQESEKRKMEIENMKNKPNG